MDQQELLLRAVEILDQLNIPYMVTGSFAVNFYGIPRTSHDIDFVAQIGAREVHRIAPEFPRNFYVDPEMIRDAIDNESMFNVIDPISGLKIDFWVLKRDLYDAERFRRRRQQSLFSKMMWLPSPEDVILSKLLWYKEAQTDKHLNDARGVLEMQKISLDLHYLHTWAKKLSLENELGKTES